METDNSDVDWCLYSDDQTENTEEFLHNAVTHFAEQHIGYPDTIVMELWRRLLLPADTWHTIRVGPITISLVSPHEGHEEKMVLFSQAICIRKKEQHEN